jgi:glycerophosphoryl diester phosphodiesterase
MTMPSFVGGSVTENGASSTTTYNIDFGVAGLSDGDVVFVTLVNDATAVVYDTSYNVESWTLIATNAASGSRSGQVFARKWRTGDSHLFQYRKNRANSDGVAAAVYRGPDFSAIVAGTGKARATAPADSGTTMTALGITTTKADTLVLSIVMEATSAAESGAFLTGPTIPSGWTQDFYRAQTGTINTITYAHKAMASPGASGDAVFTFQNTQASNAWAIQIALPAVSVVTPPSGLAGVYVDSVGTAHSGYLFYNDSANVQHPVSLPSVIFQPYTVSMMMAGRSSKSPWYAAHRGGSYNYPEETLDGYRGSAQRGARILEVSVQVSADNTFWCFHDNTTDRTTGVSGSIPAMHDTDIAALSNLGSTAGGNPTQRSRPTAKLVDVLNAFSATHVFIIEDKTYTHMTQLLTLLQSYGTSGRPASERFVIKMDIASNNGGLIAQAKAAGFKTWGYIFDNQMTASFAGALTRGEDMIGLDYASSDATLSSAIAQALAVGIMPTGHIVSSRSVRNRLLGLGIQGIMMSNVDAIYG